MASWEFMMTIFQVDAGNCIFIRTPSGHHVMVDCGSREDWSPARHIQSKKYDGFEPPLEWLIITHPHGDHIRDLDNVEHYLKPRLLRRPKVAHDILPPKDTAVDYFKGMDTRYHVPGTLADLKCTVKVFEIPKEHWDKDLNTTSIISFWEHRGHTVLLPGDMSNYGWKWLLENGGDEFKTWLKRVTILVAPHHGRTSCFYEDLFEYLHPQLTVISDGKKQSTDGADEYRAVTSGLQIRDNGELKTRYVVSTRYDGRVKIGISDEARLWVSVDEPVS